MAKNLKPTLFEFKFRDRPVLRKIINNAGWLTFEKLFRMGLVLLVNVLLARHLGPSDFGILSYAVSMISFFGAFVYLGLSGLVIRDIVNHCDQKNVIMGTTFALKMCGGLCAYLVVVCMAFFSHAGSKEFWVLVFCGFGLFFKPFETIDYWFHSQTISRFSVYSKASASLFISFVNIILVLGHAPLIVFAVTNSIETFLTAIMLIFFYYKNNQSIFTWRVYFEKAKQLIGQSWILVLSGFFSMVYLKIDQIMLRWMIGHAEVGIYSVAVNFSEVWYFLPTVIALSVYPTLIKNKKNEPAAYAKNIQKTFDGLFLISLSVAIGVTILSKTVILFLYGDAYLESSYILMIHIWAGVFIFMRALFSRIILIENLLMFSLLTHFSGAVVNIILNLFLIKMFSGYGAAVSTLFSYATASYFSLFMFASTRPFAIMMSKSLIFPLRLLNKHNSKKTIL